MKKLVCLLAMTLLLSVGCSVEQNRASQNDNNAMESARQKREMYQDQLAEKLRDLDQEISALKTTIENDNKGDKKQLHRQMTELEQKRAVAHEKLEKVRDSSQAAWEDMKAGMDAAMHDLEAAYKQADAHFK
jgi:TolA-binding protein